MRDEGRRSANRIMATGARRRRTSWRAPKARRRRSRRAIVCESGARTLQGWVLGTIVSMTSVGVLTYLGLAIIGLPMALILGLLVAELDPCA